MDKKDIVKRIVEALKAQYRPIRIILFGSQASGTANEESDIDLLIIKNTQKPFFKRLAEVRRLVSDQRQGYPFDPIVLTPQELQGRLSKGDQFLQNILTKGQPLYEQK